MNSIRRRLTYANVVASLALFLAIAGGSAFAATQLAKNSVGAKQLKKNAVTAAKIKKEAVTSAKLKKASVTGSKIKAGTITGSQINPATTPFTRVVGKFGREAVVPATVGAPYLIGTYTQPAGEIDTNVASATVNFPDSCKAPRIVQLLLLSDPVNPAAPTPSEYAGIAVFEDKVGGNLTKQLSFAPFPGGYGSTTFAAPSAATQHTFYVYPAGFSCSSGSGVAIQSAAVATLGTPSG